ncbi:hypothetical protein EK21DRAFT_100211 [Setomelanomma holmii]|uniref:Transcription factor Iwr1 domain-containing protein n=1 Tax=Setomelanomma holmii TaxID=210430 RepID=A0A9P4HA83_9PLEO|nr:hypothetical protein EK21DRAFT_100211 [Setomelanomma holmii]
MSNPPQTFSVKRKRLDTPVDTLIFDDIVKRQKSQNFAYRRLTKPNDAPHGYSAPATPTGERRFRLEPTAGGRTRHVFVESRLTEEARGAKARSEGQTPQGEIIETTPAETPRPRKRPGAGSALRAPIVTAPQATTEAQKPTEDDLRQLEALSRQVEKEDNLLIPLPSPSKHKPKAPAQRFAQRHPEKAAALAAHDDPSNGDAMEIDGEDYVYDTYIREVVLPDADGKLPEPTGTVGVLEIKEDEEDWWNASDESDKEFDTDDDDSNAEEYYANDYPEDELDEDDEYDRNLYQKKYRHGSDDEEYNLDDSDDAIGSGEDEDDLHFKMTVPKAQRTPGYWGAASEK